MRTKSVLRNLWAYLVTSYFLTEAAVVANTYPSVPSSTFMASYVRQCVSGRNPLQKGW